MSNALYAAGLKKAILDVQRDGDFATFMELPDAIGDDEEKTKAFIANPEAFAFAEVGYEVAEGYHMHFVDESNEYHPPEGDAESQLGSFGKDEKWARVEIRVGKGPKCWALCTICEGH